MDRTPQTLRDPARMAAELRDLATHAYQMLSDPATGPAETRALSRRISRLQRHVPARTAADLSLWLENLRRRVDSPSAPPSLAEDRRETNPPPARPRDSR